MNAANDKPPGRSQPAPSGQPAPRRRHRGDAFDQWLQRGLHEMFDDVAKEPVPDELLRLIEDHRDENHRDT